MSRRAEERHRTDLARRQILRNLRAVRPGQGRCIRTGLARKPRSLRMTGWEQERSWVRRPASSRRPSRRLKIEVISNMRERERLLTTTNQERWRSVHRQYHQQQDLQRLLRGRPCRHSSSPSSRHYHSTGRNACRAGPGQEPRAWHRRSCRRRSLPVREIGRHGEVQRRIDPEEEEPDRKDQGWAGRTVPEEVEAGNHRRHHPWEEEVKSTGSEEQGAEAYPTESDQWSGSRRRSVGSAGRTAGPSQEGAGHLAEVGEVQRVEEQPGHKEQG